MARNGVKLRVLQKLMRHASLATTEAYIEVLEDELADGYRHAPLVICFRRKGGRTLMMAPTTWPDAINGFKEHLCRDEQARRSYRTREVYVRHVRWASEGISETEPWRVTTAELAAFLGSRNWSTDTRRKVVVSLGRFYAWGVENGWLRWSPTAGLAAVAPRRRTGPPPAPWPESWRAPVEGYVAHLQAGGLSAGTVEQYLFRVRQLSRLAADPWEITTQQLTQWISNPSWSSQTKRGSRVAAGSFFRWAVRAGYIAESPAAELPVIRVPRGLPRPAPQDLVDEALWRSDDRTRLAILLARYAGLRRGEIARLHMDQITDVQILVDGKGGKERIVPLEPGGDLLEALRVERSRRRAGTHGSGWSGPYVSEHGYLFPSIHHPGPMSASRLGELIGDALGNNAVTAHPLRHRFATNAYAAERDLQAVQQLLGHARPETTAIYAQVPNGALLAAVIGAGSRGMSVP